MILLKGFLRKKTTRIYLAMLITLLIVIITLFSFINYYHHKMNEIFEDSSEIFIVSKIDYYDNLIKSKDFTNIRKALVFKVDYDSKLFGRQCQQIINSATGHTTDNFDECSNETVLNWEHFQFNDWKNDNIAVLPSDKINDNKVVMGYQEMWKEWAENSKHLIGKQVSFYFNNQIINFEIEKFEPFRFSRVLVSTDMFEKLSDTSKLYAYLGTPKDYSQAHWVEQKLKSSDNIEYVQINTMYDEESNNNTNLFHSIIDYLTLASYLMIIIFIIILFTVTRNAITDENKNNHIERLLGYNLNQVRKYLFLKVFALNIIAIIISMIGSVIVNILINGLKIDLVIVNPILLFKIYGSLLLVSIFLCLFYGIKINKNLKSIS
ncbi:MAG: hypothetical protein PHR09_01535 [Bacilli bacterium]|nr:hypothetical protein [Bacilli bacterium]